MEYKEMKKYKKDRVQVFNPRAKWWIKIDTARGQVIGHKLTPYKNIRKNK